MLNKRLITLFPGIGRRTAMSVAFRWLALLAGIAVTGCFCSILACMRDTDTEKILFAAAIIVVCTLLRSVLTGISMRINSATAQEAKKVLRGRIFDMLCALGLSYNAHASTAEAVQMGVEGVEQLETYFSQYMPQLFYAFASIFTVFGALCFVSARAALVLLVCVPIIPISIVAVQKLAKRLLSKYWDSYTDLGDSFLENIQGLTTLKIYRSDEMKHREMNENAERFRKATMRVLIMQLNSISIMDMVAYGGAGAGIITGVLELSKGNIDLFGGLMIVLLSAEFFIPLRQLGSFFHVAMNGAAAADRMMKILDAEPPKAGAYQAGKGGISINDLSFSYGEGEALSKISLELPERGLYAISGKSGCGKSTLAGILTGTLRGYTGSVKLGGRELRDISENSISRTVTLVSHNSFIFKGPVEYNLRLGNENATDAQLLSAVERVKLTDFLSNEKGLATEITEQGGNLSGGQRQRLALARALLHDSPIYIFDEATSNIDTESEAAIMEVVHELAKTRLVLLISHRMACGSEADKIALIDGGRLAGFGNHADLMNCSPLYNDLFSRQRELENFGGESYE